VVTGAGVRDWVHDRKVVDPSTGITTLHGDGSFQSVERLGDQSTRVWAGATERSQIDLPRAASEVASAANRVVVGYTDGTVEVLDARSGAVQLEHTALTREPVGVQIAADGGTASVSTRGGVEIWDLKSDRVRTLDDSINAAIAFSDDGSRLLVFEESDAGVFRVLDTDTGQRVGASFEPATVQLDTTTLSPDGKLFVQATTKPSIEVLRVSDGTRAVAPLRGHTNSAASVAVSPDNELLASGGYDGISIVWDLESGKRIATVRAHEATVAGVGFSPDGRLLVTRSVDGTLRVWEARTGEPVASWTDLPEGIPSPGEVDAAPRPDLGLAFTASNDALLRADDGYVYRLPCPACAEPDELLEQAHADTRRALTPAERRQYLHEGE
jgi:WD40 repeat protein